MCYSKFVTGPRQDGLEVFTGKPRVHQINIDLAEISGGGSCPSQFEGTTTDGQAVYIRYRNGTLSIDVGARVIYNETIGPRLHGDILIEQISELTGITVNGRRLSLSVQEFTSRKKDANLRDFSGRTLYWDRWVHSSTVGMDLFVERIREAFPCARLFDEHWLPPQYDRVQINWRQTASHCFGHWLGGHGYLVVSPSAKEQQRQLAFESRAAYERFRADYPQYVALPCMWNDPKTSDRKYLTRCEELYGKDFIFAGNRGVIKSQFDVNDAESRGFLEVVEQIFERTFASEIEIIDLDTGAKVREDKGEWPYSIDLIEWCGKSNSRFLGIVAGVGAGAKLGCRPRRRS